MSALPGHRAAWSRTTLWRWLWWIGRLLLTIGTALIYSLLFVAAPVAITRPLTRLGKVGAVLGYFVHPGSDLSPEVIAQAQSAHVIKTQLAALSYLGLFVAGCIVGLCVLRVRGSRRGGPCGTRAALLRLVPRRRGGLGGALLSFGGVLGMLLLGEVAGIAFPDLVGPASFQWPATGVGVRLLTGVQAALGEELFAVAAPLIAFRAWLPNRALARWRPPYLLWVLMAAARLQYHLYYGLRVALMVFTLWAITAVLMYWWFGRLWALMLAHFCFYALQYLPLPSRLAQYGFAMVAALVVAGLGWRLLRPGSAPLPRWRSRSLRRGSPLGR